MQMARNHVRLVRTAVRCRLADATARNVPVGGSKRCFSRYGLCFWWVPHDTIDPADVRDLGSQIVGGGAVGAYIAFLALVAEFQINERIREIEAEREAREAERKRELEVREKRTRTYSDFLRAVDSMAQAHPNDYQTHMREIREKFAEVELLADSPEVIDAAYELMVSSPGPPTQADSPQSLNAAKLRFIETAREELYLPATPRR
jgi:hypothetical protein